MKRLRGGAMADEYPFTMTQLLEFMFQRSASDLHLKTGAPPGLRIDGRLTTDNHIREWLCGVYRFRNDESPFGRVDK